MGNQNLNIFGNVRVVNNGIVMKKKWKSII